LNLKQFLDFLKQDQHFASCITGAITDPAREAIYKSFPQNLDPSIIHSLKESGITKLYSHQAEAVSEALNGNHTVTVTPTASGKSLTYILPIFQKKITNPSSRALLLFPTKALAQDQEFSINKFNKTLKTNYKIYTFDGDTPASARKKIREAGDFVISNPDMLHAGILPHHTTWIKLFENLEFIVIDELHTYRGIFGSHVANLLRRLLRLCDFYGSKPQFLTCSATILNPKEHAEKLTGKTFTLIENNGAPRGERHVILYNPPVVNSELGIRASSIKEAARLGSYLIKNKISTILFCRSRTRVEVLLTYLKEMTGPLSTKIRSYRGGYLPSERRKIEQELRDGTVTGVVSTNALELGVDIGALDVSVTVGFPGSFSSLHQQFGRAGRRGETSLSAVIATSDGLDQYLISHPEYLFSMNPESAIMNPYNYYVITDHLKCASFELPFRDGELFADYKNTKDLLDELVHSSLLTKSGNQYHWMSDVYPANTFGLRTGARENFVIVDITVSGNEKVIGELDLFAVPTMLHRHAIYIHQGVTYYVEQLLWDDRQARVRKIETDYYTDAEDKVDVSPLTVDETRDLPTMSFFCGEMNVRTKAVLFKKIKLGTHDNIGWGEIDTPEIEMHTQGGWILFHEENEMRKSMQDSEFGAALNAASYAISIIAPLFVLCDPGDIRIRSELRSSSFKKPVIYFFDRIPGGVELSYCLMSNLKGISENSWNMIQSCACQNGCPSCIGLPDEEFPTKARAINLLKGISHIQDT